MIPPIVSNTDSITDSITDHPTPKRVFFPVIYFPYHNGGSYVGELFEQQAHGMGRLVSEEGDVCEGEFKNGFIHNGTGILHEDDGCVFEGTWKEGLMEGTGRYSTYNHYSYEGGYTHGQFDKFGVFTCPDGKSYAGEWRMNTMHGEGKRTYSDGSYYEGSWVDGKQQGYGVMCYSNGSVYKGQFMNGMKQGQGVLTSAHGVLEGEFKQGFIYNGSGVYVQPLGHILQGTWVEGHLHGTGSSTDGALYEGNYHNGVRHGQGKLTNKEGQVCEGVWSEEYISSGSGVLIDNAWWCIKRHFVKW